MNFVVYRNIGLVILGLLATLVVALGINSGRKQAVAKFNLAQTDQVLTALQKFYKDQERYPTTAEFSNVDFFGSYISTVPVELKTAGLCTENLDYSTYLLKDYTLSIFRDGNKPAIPRLHA